MNINEVLIKPLITEKNTMLGAQGKYTFKIDRRANKTQGKEAVEAIFKVNVTAVNPISVPPKTRRVARPPQRERAHLRRADQEGAGEVADGQPREEGARGPERQRADHDPAPRRR